MEPSGLHDDQLMMLELSTLDALLVPSAVEEKRTRRTEIERLSRRRRQASLQAQRALAKQLETQLSELLAGHARRRAAADPTRPTLAPTDDVSGLETVSRGRFIDVSLEIEQLKDAHKKLRQKLRTKLVAAFSIASLTTACVDEWQDAVPPPAVLADLEYVPLRVDEYFGLLRDAFAEALTFEALLAHDRADKVCMGWHHRQQPHEHFALSSLSKSFRGRGDGETLMQETWALLSSELRLKQVFGDWSDGIRCRVLYHLSDDAFVLYRTFERRNVAKRFHSIVLLYRVQTDDGFVIGTRTIPSPVAEDMVQLPDKWITICEWIRFRSVWRSGVPPDGTAGETECPLEVEFGVAHPTPLPVPQYRLTTNFFTTVLRWEGAFATPTVLTWS